MRGWIIICNVNSAIACHVEEGCALIKQEDMTGCELWSNNSCLVYCQTRGQGPGITTYAMHKLLHCDLALELCRIILNYFSNNSAKQYNEFIQFCVRDYLL